MAHAAEQDIEVLETACGVVPSTVFDTQIVAGFLGMSSPSLSRLIDQVLGVSLPKADQLSDWLQRPIPERQITYAAGDVAYLLELRTVLSERAREARPPHLGPRGMRAGAVRPAPPRATGRALVEDG